MSRAELIAILRQIAAKTAARPTARMMWESAESTANPETGHMAADDALLEYIADDEITAAYESIKPKWYA